MSNHEYHYLPTNRPLENRSLENPMASQESLLVGVQVLLVEDELDIADLLIILLASAGAEVVWVTQASEALSLLEDLQPDVLICNIRLPDQNGDWLIQQIRAKEIESRSHLPAIAVTSYAREVTDTQMLAVGFERLVYKLNDPNELISEIATLVHCN